MGGGRGSWGRSTILSISIQLRYMCCIHQCYLIFLIIVLCFKIELMAKADLGITLIEHLFLNNLSLTPSIMDRKEKPEDKEVYKAK